MVFSYRILGRLAHVVARHGFVGIVAVAATLSGCGQKGPLFLPVPPQAPPLAMSPSLSSLAAPATAPASAAR
ncbi:MULTISPECIES: lipoprotein [unclassified Polaromonas]|uniref:LPS translocon maturation chaperone LptM n=1 Tax=unclassified Polaromonas TaxID=2638319 RepID=UPI0018CB8895|nr:MULTISPECIES: lipoprotein [unclassified Polaromonas]